MSKEKFETWIEKAQALWSKWMAAETELLTFLVDFEANGPWKDAGYNTFAMLLRQYNLTRPERYEEFKLSLKKIDTSKIRAIGVGAAIQAIRISDKKTRDDYVHAAELRTEETGFPWSDQEAERQRMRVSPDGPKPLVRVATENTLKRKLAETENALEEMRTENEQLKRENRDLKKKLGQKASSPQPRS